VEYTDDPLSDEEKDIISGLVARVGDGIMLGDLAQVYEVFDQIDLLDEDATKQLFKGVIILAAQLGIEQLGDKKHDYR